MTPHIESKLTDISPLVIMPGDPKRVEYIANNYLNDAYLVNSVRGELAYTGYYKGKRITIFSSGMGIPSMGIYSYELFKYYNVETIIRIGSAGSYKEDLLVKDIFLVYFLQIDIHPLQKFLFLYYLQFRFPVFGKELFL